MHRIDPCLREPQRSEPEAAAFFFRPPGVPQRRLLCLILAICGCLLLFGFGERTSLTSVAAASGDEAESEHPTQPPAAAPDPYEALVAQTDPLTPEEQQAMFRLPPGFEIQLVAAEPDIQKPMNLNFDTRGRLYVTHSVEYPYPAEEGATPRDGLTILDEFGDDGRAGRMLRFADGLNIPIGVLPLDDSVLVHSIPAIYRLRDTNGDQTADERQPLYATFSYADTHGMTNSFTRWIDGWVYATHGFANRSTVSGQGESEIEMHSGNTYRMRPDGAHLEHYTHGQVNPFGLAFDPLGNLYSADCHTKPIYMLLRGAYYPSFGKPHDGLGFGPEMIAHLHGSTGIAGVIYYAADHFPPEYRNTVFIGNPVTGRVNHDRLASHGSTYRAIELPDFVSCDDPWFRPVDLQLGPDGAIYMADFYNAVIGHYEVPLTHPRRDRHRGRIWRIVYVGEENAAGDKTAAPLRPIVDLTALSCEELIERLGDLNLTVRTLATHELVDRLGEAAIEPVRAMLRGRSTGFQRAHGLWVLERLGALDDDLVARLSKDFDRAVRTHLGKALAERPAWSSTETEIVRARLNDADPFVRRAAADALGRHPDVEQVLPLLELWATTDPADTHLIHVVRMALRDHLLVDGMYAALAPRLADRPDDVLRLAELSLGAPTAASAAFLLQTLSSHSLDRERLGKYLHHATRHLADDQLASAFAYAEIFDGSDVDDQVTVVGALQRAMQERGEPLPPGMRRWTGRLTVALLGSHQEHHVRRGIELAREAKLGATLDALAQAAGSKARFPELRPAAIEALMELDADLGIPVVEQVLCDTAEPLPARQRAAALLGSSGHESTRGILLEQLPLAPEQLAVTIAEALAASREGSEALLAYVSEGKASPRVLLELNVSRRLQSHKLPNLDARVGQLTAGLPPADERIAQLIGERRAGFLAATPDPVHGAQVFKKVCAACHRLQNEGHKIGPELDGVGIRGLDRLLEDILDPSRNVDQAFRATLVTTVDGRVLSGLALRDEGNVLVLADAEGKEVRVPHDEIDERDVGNLSPMPNNAADLIPPDEFYDLLAYLLSQRQESTQTAAGGR